jgi:hypothetical protein
LATKRVTFKEEFYNLVLSDIKAKSHNISATYKLLLQLYLKRYFDEDFVEKMVKATTKSSNKACMEGLLALITYDTGMFKDSLSYNTRKKVIKMLVNASVPKLWLQSGQWNVK